MSVWKPTGHMGTFLFFSMCGAYPWEMEVICMHPGEWKPEGSLWCVLFPLATITGYTSDGGCCCSLNARKRVTLSREHSPPGLGMQHKYKMTYLVQNPWKLLVASSDIFLFDDDSTGTDESKVERMTCFSLKNPVESFQMHSETAASAH